MNRPSVLTTLAVLGIVASIVAFLPYFDAPDVCGSLGGSCATVVASPYGTVFGLPAPVASASYFAAVLALLGGETPNRWRVLLALCAAGAAASLWLIVVSAALLGAWCASCLVVHACSIGLSVAVGRAAWHDSWVRSVAPWLALAALLGGLGAASWYVLRPPDVIHALPHQHLAYAPTVWGGHGRSISVVVDPACPTCARRWGDLAGSYDVRVGLYPVEQPCLELMHGIDASVLEPPPERHHLGACRLAAHIFCSSRQDRHGEMLAVAFAELNRHGSHAAGRWNAAEYLELSRRAGLNIEQQLECTGESTAPWSPAAMPERERRAFAQHLASAARVLDGQPVPFLFHGP